MNLEIVQRTLQRDASRKERNEAHHRDPAGPCRSVARRLRPAPRLRRRCRNACARPHSRSWVRKPADTGITYERPLPLELLPFASAMITTGASARPLRLRRHLRDRGSRFRFRHGRSAGPPGLRAANGDVPRSTRFSSSRCTRTSWCSRPANSTATGHARASNETTIDEAVFAVGNASARASSFATGC